MLISHSHKFATIDIPKTGTRTLRETLLPLGIIDVVGRPGNSIFEFRQHGTANEQKQTFEERGWDWDQYVKFVFVRNPWKRYASQVNYERERAIDFQRASDKEIATWDIAKQNQGKGCLYTFNRLNWNYQAILKRTINKQANQLTYFSNDSGDVLLTDNDIIGQTETINESFAQLCQAVNISPIPELCHSNKGTYQRPWQDIYNQKLIDMVAEKEKWVIEKFNYQF